MQKIKISKENGANAKKQQLAEELRSAESGTLRFLSTGDRKRARKESGWTRFDGSADKNEKGQLA